MSHQGIFVRHCIPKGGVTLALFPSINAISVVILPFRLNFPLEFVKRSGSFPLANFRFCLHFFDADQDLPPLVQRDTVHTQPVMDGKQLFFPTSQP